MLSIRPTASTPGSSATRWCSSRIGADESTGIAVATQPRAIFPFPNPGSVLRAASRLRTKRPAAMSSTTDTATWPATSACRRRPRTRPPPPDSSRMTEAELEARGLHRRYQPEQHARNHRHQCREAQDSPVESEVDGSSGTGRGRSAASTSPQRRAREQQSRRAAQQREQYGLHQELGDQLALARAECEPDRDFLATVHRRARAGTPRGWRTR